VPGIDLPEFAPGELADCAKLAGAAAIDSAVAAATIIKVVLNFMSRLRVVSGRNFLSRSVESGAEVFGAEWNERPPPLSVPGTGALPAHA
jgi:hypothetical protein